MPMLDILTAISSAATAVGVAVAAFQLRITKRQSVTSFEDSLTNQYRQVLSSIPLKALFGETLSDNEHSEHLEYFYRYFDLCNEQVFLQRNGRISKETWIFWREGIISNMLRPAFELAWIEVSIRAPNDFDELRKLCPSKGK